MLKIYQICALVGISIAMNTPINGSYNECSPNQDKCEYWLTIKRTVTMVYKSNLVYASNGKLFKYDEFPNNFTTEIPIDDVISVDGFYRTVIAVNGTIPGPPIVVYEGQNLIIHVKNELLSDTVTMHWHGLHQRGTPFMDGVGIITQCAILSGQTFTYKFKADPKGTFWYHSHVGAQRMNGVFGALIVKERPSEYATQPIDMIMTVGDWEHEAAEDTFIKTQEGFFENGKRVFGVPWVSGLIEGRGRYTNDVTNVRSEAPLTAYKVIKGETYRFRVIGTGGTYGLRISVDNHLLTIVASDGYDVEPVVVESFIITPGERYDFLLTADQEVKNYWIRATSINPIFRTILPEEGAHVNAILHYDGATKNADPTTNRTECSSTNQCLVLNCPVLSYPASQHIDCLLITDLKRQDYDCPPEYKSDSQEHFLNFHLPGPPLTLNPAVVNGRIYKFPTANSLTQDNEIDEYDCSKADCGDDKLCHCNYEINVPFGKTIQLVFLNMGVGGVIGHPIHLHGHSFYVLKMEYASNGSMVHEDVDCGSTPKNFCNNPRWKNPAWNNGNVPGLNLVNPIRKDTINIPTGAYAVVRIRSDNPGKWFLHCHIETHVLEGMAMVLSEAIEHVPKPPKGFPICHNFYNNPKKDIGCQARVKARRRRRKHFYKNIVA